MKRHETDPVSLVPALVFLGFAGWWTLDRLTTVDLPLAWLTAITLLASGTVGLVVTLTGRRPAPVPTAPGAGRQQPAEGWLDDGQSDHGRLDGATAAGPASESTARGSTAPASTATASTATGSTGATGTVAAGGAVEAGAAGRETADGGPAR